MTPPYQLTLVSAPDPIAPNRKTTKTYRIHRAVLRLCPRMVPKQPTFQQYARRLGQLESGGSRRMASLLGRDLSTVHRYERKQEPSRQVLALIAISMAVLSKERRKGQGVQSLLEAAAESPMTLAAFKSRFGSRHTLRYQRAVLGVRKMPDTNPIDSSVSRSVILLLEHPDILPRHVTPQEFRACIKQHASDIEVTDTLLAQLVGKTRAMFGKYDSGVTPSWAVASLMTAIVAYFQVAAAASIDSLIEASAAPSCSVKS